MLPILQQTLANYAALGAAGAFSGPIVRGDVETVRSHIRTLKENTSCPRDLLIAGEGRAIALSGKK